MNPESEHYWNYRYHRLIPEAYRTREFKDYRFRILSAQSNPVPMASSSDPEGGITDYSAQCAIMLNGNARGLLISKEVAPKLYHALLFLGEAFFTGNRALRYLTIFKSYECIAEERAAEFSAVRHALAHPGELLTRRSTIAALEQLFGSRTIDLQSSRHQRIFFRQFGRLLIENDRLLNIAIRSNLPSWYRWDSGPDDYCGELP